MIRHRIFTPSFASVYLHYGGLDFTAPQPSGCFGECRPAACTCADRLLWAALCRLCLSWQQLRRMQGLQDHPRFPNLGMDHQPVRPNHYLAYPRELVSTG